MTPPLKRRKVPQAKPFNKDDYWAMKNAREKARDRRPAVDVPTVAARNAECKTLFEQFSARCTLRKVETPNGPRGVKHRSPPTTKGEPKPIRRIMRSLGNLESLSYSQRKYLALTERRLLALSARARKRNRASAAR